MAVAFDKIDPEWAWSPYEARADEPWNRRLAAHLYRRAGFAANSEQLDKAVDNGPQDSVARLVEGGESDRFVEDTDELVKAVLAGGDPKRLAAWWLYRMLNGNDQLHEKITLFWHGHFATSAAKVSDPRLMHRQNLLLRKYALGDFSALVQEISRDAAMLIYLDSVNNRKAHPNENFAREVMELFCLGEGAYSEKDIQELARCFTGWEIRRGEFHFNSRQHDVGEKNILGGGGQIGGEQGVELVLQQASSPRFIVGKLMRFFLFDEPAAPERLIEPLAQQLRDDEWRIGPVVRRMLGSNLFFSSHALARKVRSPVELGVGLLRALVGATNVNELSQGLADLGQELFFPPSVKGWDGGRTWINSATLLDRTNLVRRVLEGGKAGLAPRRLEQSARSAGAETAEETVEWLCELLLAVEPPAEARSRLIEVVGAGNRGESIARAVYIIAALPEFQIS